MIPKDKVDEVIARADIVDVVSGYMALKKSGRNHIGLCPFHSEKTPSFTVNDQRQMFYCFGCNTGGSAITFVMKKEGLGFLEAVRVLARRLGINIVEKESSVSPRDGLYAANQLALGYFRDSLKSHAGTECMAYIKKRGVGEKEIELFGIGYAPSTAGGLIGFLRAKGIKPEDAFTAGVVGKKDGRFFDWFRDRLVFPICDITGRIIAFGARTLKDEIPKYLNSPETPVFKKSEALFGLYHAKDAIRKEGSVIVAEGYLDVIALHGRGFGNSVATMGTALSVEHIRRLKSYAGSIYLFFDADTAGRSAVLRVLVRFLEEDMPARVVMLDEGDPDEFLNKSGAEAMRKELKQAVPLFEFFLNELKTRHDIKTPEGKARYFDEAEGRLRLVKNPAEKAHYIAIIAANMGIRPELLYQTLVKDKGLSNPKGAAAMAAKSHVLSARGAHDILARLVEETILKVILRHPAFFDKRVEAAIEGFKEPLLKKVGTLFMEALDNKDCEGVSNPKDFSLPVFIAGIDDEETRNWIAKACFFTKDDFMDSPEKMLEDSLVRLKEMDLPKASTIEQIKRLEDAGLGELALEMRDRMGRNIALKRGGDLG
ncbi:MAG: DNA primase [Deltaproteobacteria bacterium]|nr:DNA primase [Deltaproteobacteria bacterium]